MKITLSAARFAVAVITVSASFAFAGSEKPPTAIAEGALDDNNHYILECAAACTRTLVAGAISPSHTGAWYDPAQSGHGLFIEVLPDNKIQAAWFTFNPQGTEQAWFLGVGTYTGNKATIKVAQPTGGRWIPNFDPKQVVNNTWGSLTLTFSDVDHASIEFNTATAYGTGKMNLTRLTRPIAASDPNWVSTGSLNVARSGAKSVLLPNGKVLVVGGIWGGNATESWPVADDSAELYDPSTGIWSRTGKLNVPRGGGLSLTRLDDGNVLLVGGYVWPAEQYFDVLSAELYDVQSETWSRVAPAAVARSGHSASLLRDGKVLIAGGGAGYLLGTAELYDPVTNTWTSTGSLNQARASHWATVLQSGKVLVSGGVDYNDEDNYYRTRMELYDPATGGWSYVVGADELAGAYKPVLLNDGKVLFANALDLAVTPPNTGWKYLDRSILFDPDKSTWIRSGTQDTSRVAGTPTLLANGDVLYAGGGWDYRTQQATTTAMRYGASSRQWTSAGITKAQPGSTATLLADGSVLVAGGVSYDPISSTISYYRDAAVFVDRDVSPTSIRPELTGSWYDPVQSGHGLFVEVLPDNQFLAAWFTFNPAGTQQSWFVGVGNYSGDTATVTQVFLPTGGRWIPNFDPNQIVNNPWGTLTFTFADCNHGKVDFASTLGYGVGGMNLTRLTQPTGLTCP